MALESFDVGVEANAYNYKLTPGFNREVYAPIYLEILGQSKALLASQNLLDNERKEKVKVLERKLQILIDGGTVGDPRVKV